MRPIPKKRFFISELAYLFSLMLIAVVPAVGHAATFTVNSLLDKAGLAANCASGTGECTLRSAIQAANASGAADIINIPPGTYTLTILGQKEDAAATGDLDITGLAANTLTINGTGLTPASTVINGGAIDRVFDLIGTAPVTISNLTIRNGNPGVGASGGGIQTGGAGRNLTLTNVVITGNTAPLEGGAMNIGAGGAIVTMTNVAITNNTSPGGGGIAHGSASTLNMTNGTISGNNDGGINNGGGTINLTNVTISLNVTAGNGGAIDNNKAGGNVKLVNCTITDNTAPAAAVNSIGGIRNAATVNFTNTIIANNTNVNCGGAAAFTSLGNNLTNVAGCGLTLATDVVTAAIGLDPLGLGNNGGALQTVALLAGSPAIDTGSVTACPATDARGITRPVDGNIPLDGVLTCDKGAYEFRPQRITVTLAPPFDFGTVATGTTLDHAITLANAGDGALVIGALAVTDPLAAPFSIPVAIDTCSGKTLSLAGTCTFTVRFVSPLSIIPTSDTFNIPSNDPATPVVSFAVSGTGTVAPVPQIAVTDSIAPATDLKALFGSVTTDSTSDATITIANPGNAPLVIGTIAGAAPLAAPFSFLSNTCSGQTIAPLATCTLTARFAPATTGIFDITFNIPSNDPATPTVSFALSGLGTALPVPLISVTDSIAPATDLQVPFNGVLVNTSADATIIATNPGTANLSIGQIASVNAPFSILNDTCSGKTIAPSATCTLTVRFAPTAGAPVSGTLVIPSNVAATPAVSIALSGTGTSLPPVPLISVTDSIAPATDQLVPFGVVLVGGSADATIMATNTGTADLVIGQIASANPLAAPFSILNDTCSGRTMAPAATCTLTVRFAPTAVASASETFDIPSIGLQAVTVSVNGIGNANPTTTPTGTDNSPPTNPVLVSPTNGQTGIPTLMTFTWKKSVDADGDAVTYHFIYGTDPNLAGAQTVNVASSKSAGFLFAGLGSVGGGLVMFGFVSGSGMKRSRKLLLVIPVFLLIGALFTACSSGSDTTTPPTTTTPPDTTSAGLVSATITGLAANTTYYWKVVADDGKGSLAASETFSFKTQ